MAVCVDASLALAWVLPDPLQPEARELRRRWQARDEPLIAPPLFRAEVTSVIRETVYRRAISPEDGEVAFAASLEWDVSLITPPGLQQRAWSLAVRLNRPKGYDAQYLALASLLDCEVWTMDRRLYNAARARYPWVHWAGELAAPDEVFTR